MRTKITKARSGLSEDLPFGVELRICDMSEGAVTNARCFQDVLVYRLSKPVGKCSELRTIALEHDG